MLYIIIILAMMTLITVFNVIFNPYSSWYIYILETIYFTVLVILIDGLVAFIIRKMNEKHFDYHKKIFNATKNEIKFYEAIGIKKWKELVPELGQFTNFRKNKIDKPKDSKYLDQYILEACYGVIIHIVSSPISFIILLFDIGIYGYHSNLFLTIALPVAITNAILILLPAFILKYNLVKLIRINNILKIKNLG